MKRSILLVVACALGLSGCNSAKVLIFEFIPSSCEVVESFTLFSNSPTKRGRVSELFLKSHVTFNAVAFSDEHYSTQKKSEEIKFEKYLADHPDLIVDPNFYGVPENSEQYRGVLLSCSNNEV